jgi:drug/metabolite transporter (DMT)-like permease
LNSTSFGARLAVCAAVVIWGISFVATKAALRELSPITLICTRFALGTVVLLGILALRREPLLPPRGEWPMLASMGFVGVFVHQMLQVYGLSLTTAVRTGWLIGVIPIWSAVLAAIFLGESFGARKLLGLLVGAAGAVLVITRGRLSAELLALPSTRGDLLILASTLNWAIYTILGRGTIKRLGPARATAAAMLVGWAMMIPFFVASVGWTEYRALSSTGWLAVLFLGVGASGLGYLFWYTGMERLETSEVAVFLYIEPLVTLLAAVSLLGETVAPSTILGGILVLTGVFIVQRTGAAAVARFAPGRAARGS